MVLGLNILAWFFPVGQVAALFGFITLWAVVGKKWAIAMTLVAFAPSIVQEISYSWIIISPLWSGFSHAIDSCHYAGNQTLMNVCVNQNLNLTQSPLLNFTASLPKPPPAIAPIPASHALAIVFVGWFAIVFFFLRRIYPIKERIRKTIGRKYSFR